MSSLDMLLEWRDAVYGGPPPGMFVGTREEQRAKEAWSQYMYVGNERILPWLKWCFGRLREPLGEVHIAGSRSKVVDIRIYMKRMDKEEEEGGSDELGESESDEGDLDEDESDEQERMELDEQDYHMEIGNRNDMSKRNQMGKESKVGKRNNTSKRDETSKRNL
jgi:hypothetical protein